MHLLAPSTTSSVMLTNSTIASPAGYSGMALRNVFIPRVSRARAARLPWYVKRDRPADGADDNTSSDRGEPCFRPL